MSCLPINYITLIVEAQADIEDNGASSEAKSNKFFRCVHRSRTRYVRALRCCDRWRCRCHSYNNRSNHHPTLGTVVQWWWSVPPSLPVHCLSAVSIDLTQSSDTCARR